MILSGSAVQVKGFGSVVVLGEEAVDGGLEVDDRSEDAALEPSLGQLGEEAFDGVEPGGRGRREVEGEARMAAEPGRTLGCCGRRSCRGSTWTACRPDLGLDGVEEADELLMAVTLHAAADDRAVEDVQAANSVVVPCRL